MRRLLICSSIAGLAFTNLASAAAETIDSGIGTLVQISDPRWLEHELTRFGAATGREPKPFRLWLARTCFRSRDLDGIDLSRPAVLAWRTGPAPCLAIIPVKDRQVFLDQFGASDADEAPMVRTGDRDGLVVFTQNSAKGLQEYRLLVLNDTAYLARSAAECRQLAEQASLLLPRPERDGPALRIRASGTTFAGKEPHLAGFLHGLGLSTTWPGEALWGRLWQTGLAQAETCELGVTGLRDQIRFRLSLSAKSGSEMARWSEGQRNSGSRLTAMADPRDVALRLTATATWGGVLAAWGKGMDLGDGWNRAFSGADRGGEWALTVAVPEPGHQINSLYLEHPRPTELLQMVDEAAAVVGGSRVATSVPGAAAAGRTSTGASLVLFATNRHLVVEEGIDLDLPALTQRAGDVVPRLIQVGQPGNDSAIATLWCDVDRLVRVSPTVDRDAPVMPAVVAATLKLDGPRTLQLEAVLRPEDVARALALVPTEH